MNPKAIAEAFAMLNAALELVSLAVDTFKRLQDAASDPITDAEVTALAAQRGAALERLKSAVG